MGMTQQEARKKVLEAFYSIVPEAQDEEIREDLGLREQFDMDSVDFLNFIIRLHKDFQVEIPEADYRQLTTLDKIAGYLLSK